MSDRQKMSDRPGDEASREERLAEVFAHYMDRLNAGETIDEREVCRAHPDLAADLIGDIRMLREVPANSETAPSLGTLGDYTLRRQIGRGGMGVVYEAWQNSVERQVALKVLPAGVAADERALQRFVREAKTAAQLSHQHIVRVHGMGVEDNTPYYAMEYVEGETLAQVMARVKKSGPDSETPFGKKDDGRYFMNLAESFADVADGLQHAHSKGVTHRDIKPSNLILDQEGRLRILDFGLARLEGQESLSISGDLVGTPLYMSPEQAQQRKIKVDHRTDVYSLGATMYEMLTARPPFRGKDHRDTLSQIIERDPTEPRNVNPRVPKDLETIVLKCLRKNPADRYGTAEALGQDLRRYVRGDPIEARPQSRATIVKRWLHVRRRILTLAGMAVLLGISLCLLFWQRHHEARFEAETAYGPTVREAAMLVLKSRLLLNAASGREVTGSLSVEPSAALLPDDFRPDKHSENELKTISEKLEWLTRELPDGPEAHYYLISAFMLLGRPDKAEDHLSGVPRAVRKFVPLRLLEATLTSGLDGGVDGVTARAAADILEDTPELASWERAWLRAQREVHRENWDVAAFAYDEILDSAPEPFVGASLQARIERGIAQLELKDYRGAIGDFYRAWGRWPELPEPALLLGKAYYLSGDPEGAEYVYNQLHDGMPESERKAAATWIAAVYYQLGDRGKAVEWAAHVDGTLRSRLRCWPLLWGGRYEEAVDCFRAALGRYPDDVNLRCTFGYSLAYATGGRRGARRDAQVAELNEVAERLEDTVLSRPETERDASLTASVCYLRTLALCRQDDHAGALAAIERFRRRGETHRLIDIAHAGVLVEQGAFEAAEEVFPIADDLSAPAWGIFGKALEGQGPQRYAEAREAYKKVIAGARRNGSGYSLLARVFLAERKFEAAIKACQMAIERPPKNTSAHETLALALLASGDGEGALDATDVGIKAVRDRPELHVVRGKVLLRLGRLPDAVASLCEALELHSANKMAQKALRELLQTPPEPLTPEERRTIYATLQEKLSRTDSAEIRAILKLLDDT